MRRKAGLALAAALALLAGCSTVKQVVHEAARIDPRLKKLDTIVAQFERYEKFANIFKKYHDKGNLDEGDVLDVLYTAGVLKKAPPVRPGSKPPPQGPGSKPQPQPPGTKPFPVPDYKGAWRWPLDAGIVSSEFGPRWGKFHYGIDIAADKGKPIYAAAPGEVIYSGSGLTGYGNVLFIRHDENTVSIYAHNDSLKVRKGEAVKQGQLIAALGSTGHSTGPHLHFEVRKNDKAIPPRSILPKSRF
jgi:murein DD-endopeptidase MepM/ murein hydrolase activator NlpD